MSDFPIPAAVLLSLVLSSCATSDPVEFVGDSNYLLQESVLQDGGVVSYRLRVRSTGLAHLVVQTERDVKYTEVGIEVVELDKQRAKDLEDRPLSGLLITAVEEGSPAAKAGIKVDEVLVKVDGKPVVRLEAYGNSIEALAEDKLYDFQLRASGEPEGELRRVSVKPETKEWRSTKVDNVRLLSSKKSNPVAYMGVRLRAFPPAHTRAVFGHDRPVSVICGVVLGSPAYRAGLRSGDILLRIDGEHAPGPDGMQALLREKGPREELLAVAVRSRYGEYKTAVRLEDYAGVDRTYLPLLWYTRVSAQRTKWNILLGGWLFGYDNKYTPTRNRQPAERGHFTMLMGIFRQEWSPAGLSTRLFWFLHID